MNNPPFPPHRKRKRAPSDQVINPLSHPPDTLRQFAVAGYPIEKPLPSKAYPGFPHRAARPQRTGESEDEDEDGNEEAAGPAFFRSRSASAASDADGEQEDDEDDDEDNDGEWRTTDGETTEAETDGGGAKDHHGRGRTGKGKGGGGGGRGETVDRQAQAYRARVGWLTAAVRRSLAEGDVATARRAFGLLVRV